MSNKDHKHKKERFSVDPSNPSSPSSPSSPSKHTIIHLGDIKDRIMLKVCPTKKPDLINFELYVDDEQVGYSGVSLIAELNLVVNDKLSSYKKGKILKGLAEYYRKFLFKRNLPDIQVVVSDPQLKKLYMKHYGFSEFPEFDVLYAHLESDGLQFKNVDNEEKEEENSGVQENGKQKEK